MDFLLLHQVDRSVVNPQTGYSPSDMSNPTIVKNGGILGNILNSVNPSGNNSIWAKLAPAVLAGGPDAALTGIPEAAQIGSDVVKGGASIAGDLMSILTGKGLWNNIVDAAKSPIDWGNVSTRALSNAKNEIQPVKDLISQVLQQEGPKTTEATIPNPEPVSSGALDNSPITTTGSVGNPLYKRDMRFSIGNQDAFKDVPQQSESSNPNITMPDSPLTGQTQPSVLSSQPQIYQGSDALGKRVALGESIPNNFWGQSNLDSVQSKAYAYVRNALSDELKLANPDMVKADSMYSQHQNVKALAPKAAGALGIGGIGYEILSKILGSGSGNNPQ